MTGDAPAGEPPPAGDLKPATAEETAEAIAFALRFDARGKPRRTGGELTAALAAERIAEHLQRAGLLVFRDRPARPHST